MNDDIQIRNGKSADTHLNLLLWHELPPDEVVAALKTAQQTGLTEQEAAQRLHPRNYRRIHELRYWPTRKRINSVSLKRGFDKTQDIYKEFEESADV